MNNKSFSVILGVAIAVSASFWIFMFQNKETNDYPADSSGIISLTMYHAEGCDCCVKWADYLVDRGFLVVQEKVPNLQAVKQSHNVPGVLSSCHTAITNGYVIEGHVPAEDIHRLLTDQPDAIGLAAPGMPASSPGMDLPSDQIWHTVLFDETTMTIFNTHNE
ncbi:MAG TPA: DUF411 domain-containing protein [Balneolaceae bacterium]|nr:DUF411 domain-containing protein [Balneolaceae bacterium]